MSFPFPQAFAIVVFKSLMFLFVKIQNFSNILDRNQTFKFIPHSKFSKNITFLKMFLKNAIFKSLSPSVQKLLEPYEVRYITNEPILKKQLLSKH